MVNIQIGLDGVPSLRKVTIGNKYENQDEIISFTLPSEFDNFDKYVISVIKINGQKYTSILPIINNQLIVSTQLTQYAGKWSMYLMAREKTSLDLNTTPVDISAKDNERIFISDGFIGVVSDSEIEKENIEALTLDANLQIIYDDLAKLRDEIVERMKTPLSYTQLIDVPTEFNPAPHDHDARYHTKEEMDLKLVNKADVEHSHDDLYYTKLKTDDLLKSKSDVTHNHNESYYGKSEIDDLLSVKANNEHSHNDLYYGKLETDKLLENKSSIAHVHDDRYNTKDEVTVLLTSKADINHTHEIVDITDFPTSLPANGGNADTVNNHTVFSNVPASAQFTDTVYVHPETHPASMITGLPTKVSELENDKKYQTANEVAKAISDLVKLAPDTLNTLEELANALGNDPHFATTIMTMLGEKASKADLTTKVDVVAGKMLSSNDFTNELKTKLESLSNYDDSKLKALITSNQSALNTELAKKVTQIEGKQLSTNDYSTAEKNKLASLNNYDDSAIVKQLKELSDRVNGISMSITALSVTDGVLKMSVDVQEGGKQ